MISSAGFSWERSHNNIIKKWRIQHPASTACTASPLPHTHTHTHMYQIHKKPNSHPCATESRMNFNHTSKHTRIHSIAHSLPSRAHTRARARTTDNGWFCRCRTVTAFATHLVGILRVQNIANWYHVLRIFNIDQSQRQGFL